VNVATAARSAPARVAPGTPAPAPAGTRSRRGVALVVVGLAAALGVSIVVAVGIGSVAIPAGTVGRIIVHRLAGLGEPSWPTAHEEIVWQVRLPRVLLAAVIGAGLSVVGTTLQALVRNPLADPYVLGITSGASVGAVTVILLGWSAFGVYSLSASAFLGALAAFGVVFLMAQQGGTLFPTRLVLAGVAVSYVLSAVTSFLIFQADDDGIKARSVLFWLLGGLGGARWSYLGLPAAAVIGGTTLLVLQGRRLNALVMGEETATGLGLDVARFRRQLFLLASLLTAAMVAVSGGIGFVGLMMPHACRLAVGPDHRRVLPVAALAGAVFLVWADVGARTVVAPEELPIGIITALVGGPTFCWLVRRRLPRTAELR
jgi:iron complex transport system permease protein